MPSTRVGEYTGESTPVIHHHRSIQNDVWHRSNPRLIPTCSHHHILDRQLEGIMPQIDFLKKTLGRVDLGRGSSQLSIVLAGQLSKASLHFKEEDDFGNLVFKYKHFKDQIFRKSRTILGGSIVTLMVDYTGQHILIDIRLHFCQFWMECIQD